MLAILGCAGLMQPRDTRGVSRLIAGAAIATDAALLLGLVAVSLGHADGVLWSELPWWADALTLTTPVAGVLVVVRTAGATPASPFALAAGFAAAGVAQVVSAFVVLIPRVPLASAFTMSSPHVLLAVGVFLSAVGIADRVRMSVLGGGRDRQLEAFVMI